MSFTAHDCPRMPPHSNAAANRCTRRSCRRSRSTGPGSTGRRRSSSAAARSRCAERSTTERSRSARYGQRISGSTAAPPLHALEADVPPALALRGLMRAEAFGGARSALRGLDAVAATSGAGTDIAADTTRPCGPRLHRQRRARRRRRGARGPLRARHRTHPAGRRDRRLARQQFLCARQRERERHHRRAGSARQLSCRSQQRPGMVSAVAAPRSRACRRSRCGARPGRVESRLQPVLAASARIPSCVDELRRHQRRRSARAGVGHSRARSGGQDRRGARLSLRRGQGALDRQGTRRVRLPDGGPDAAPARRGVRGMRSGGTGAREIAQRTTPRSRGALARMLADDIDAIAFVRVPQFPSSRAFGDAPVVTPWEFQKRLPADRSKLQIIPVPPRPFPDSLRAPGSHRGQASRFRLRGRGLGASFCSSAFPFLHPCDCCPDLSVAPYQRSPRALAFARSARR